MQEANRRVGIRLELLTVGWNTIEALVAISAGITAGSVALVAFGLDSVVEISSALVVLWQFAGIAEERERLALRFIGWSFFVLAAYVSISAIYDLATTAEPDASTVGIVLTALSLAVMPLLAWAKRRAGERIGSRTLIADSRETLICSYLSASTLLGLIGNAALGWWWTDPLAALVIAGFAVKEGREAWTADDD